MWHVRSYLLSSINWLLSIVNKVCKTSYFVHGHSGRINKIVLCTPNDGMLYAVSISKCYCWACNQDDVAQSLTTKWMEQQLGLQIRHEIIQKPYRNERTEIYLDWLCKQTKIWGARRTHEFMERFLHLLDVEEGKQNGH